MSLAEPSDVIAPGETNTRTAASLPPAVLVAAIAVAPAAATGLVVGLAWTALAGLVAAAVAAAAVAVAVWLGADRTVAAGLGGRPADPRVDARLVNIVDWLCTGAGVRVPRLVVVDATGVNLAVAGRDPSAAVLAVTSGLLERLSRIELEGILAAGIVQIRRRDVVGATVAAVIGLGAARVVGAERDLLVDAAAVSLTRYPPGLQAALESCLRHGTEVPGASRRLAPLWLADPSGGAAPVPYRRPLEERIAALQEL